MLYAILLALAIIYAEARSAALRRHRDYLQQELHGAGGDDRWNVRCTHCGKRMRDAPSTRLSTRVRSESGWVERTQGVFHTDRPECRVASATRAMENSLREGF